MYLALSSISGAADAPTETDLALLADAVALTAQFLKEDYKGFTFLDRPGLVADIENAYWGLGEAYVRYRAKNVIRLNGNGLVAVRKVLHSYFELLKIAPERTVIRLHRATEAANIKARNENKATILKGART